MLRFNEGQRVLVNSFMGKDCAPLRPATVVKLLGRASRILDYTIQIDGDSRQVPVQDSWLTSWDYTICELMDVTEL